MTTSQKIIKNKLGVLGLAQQLGNVSKACKIWAIVGMVSIALKSYMNKAEN